MVGARRRHLIYLSKVDPKAYEALVGRLGLRRR
jgi:ribosomal protein S15P/S13E